MPPLREAATQIYRFFAGIVKEEGRKEGSLFECGALQFSVGRLFMAAFSLPDRSKDALVAPSHILTIRIRE